MRKIAGTIGIFTALFIASACHDESRILPGNAELGIAELRLDESATTVSLVGIDADGAAIATIDLRIGSVVVEEIEHAGLGRELRIELDGRQIDHASVGLLPLSLPYPDEPTLEALLRDASVADVLGRWGVGFVSPRDVQQVEDDPYSHGGWCNGFWPPCGGTPVTSCCMTHARFWGPSGWESEQLAVCEHLNPKIHTQRACAYAFASTSCGQAGNGGCAVCWSQSYSDQYMSTQYTSLSDSCNFYCGPNGCF